MLQARLPASGVGVQLCPSAPGGGAGASCAATSTSSLAARPPSISAVVPGSTGRQQREEELFRSSRRRRRSSSGGTGQASKKRPRERSPSPGHSSCCREESYRSSSSSEEDRAESPPPSSGRAPGGTPGDSCPAPAGDRSPRPGLSGWRPRSSTVADQYRSGFGGHMSSPPPGEADDDRSSAPDSLDIDRDDSFRSVLALIPNFHRLEEPAGVLSARCKTSLASIYGLMSETSPAFHLPTSPLLRSLLVDTRRSSSGGTGRASKKHPRERSPSPGSSSFRREESYRSSSSSEEDRAESPPPSPGRVPGGTPGDSCPAPAGDRSPRPGPSGWRPRSSAAADRYRSGFGGHLSSPPPGEADDDRSSAPDSLDIDRDDSFRPVLALIRNFHRLEEPAGVPSARCKTSLASIYGLMSETSPAFHLPTSPLLRSLLVDTNLALSKFLEDQTVHGFLPVPSRRHRRYYRTSSSSFLGPFSVPPGVTSITLEKAS